jgi:hypothetical protein
MESVTNQKIKELRKSLQELTNEINKQAEVILKEVTGLDCTFSLRSKVINVTNDQGKSNEITVRCKDHSYYFDEDEDSNEIGKIIDFNYFTGGYDITEGDSKWKYLIVLGKLTEDFMNDGTFKNFFEDSMLKYLLLDREFYTAISEEKDKQRKEAINNVVETYKPLYPNKASLWKLGKEQVLEIASKLKISTPYKGVAIEKIIEKLHG